MIDSSITCLEDAHNWPAIGDLFNCALPYLKPCGSRSTRVVYLRSRLHSEPGPATESEILDALAEECEGDLALRSDLTYLAGVAQFLRRDLTAATSSFRQAGSHDHDYLQKTRALELCHALVDQPDKKPEVAALLGLIPGAGYAYAGFRETGLTTLLLLGAVTMSARAAIQRGERGFGYFFGGLGIVWYAGSIYGSALSAERYNAQTWETAAAALSY